MNPQKKAVIFFFFILGLCVFILLWMTVLNQGTVVISAEAPYQVEAFGSKVKGLEKISCGSNPCIFKLRSGKFTLVFKKEGYFEEKREISLKRGKQERLEINFQFIPKITEVEGEEEIFEEAISFDPSAFSFLEESLAWSFNQNQIFYLGINPETKRQTLFAYDLSQGEGESEPIAVFMREIERAQIFPAPSLKELILADQTERENTLYLINLGEKSRTKLADFSNVTDLLWSGDGKKLVVETLKTRTGEITLWLWDLESSEKLELALKTPLEKVAWDENDDLVFATKQNLETDLQGKPGSPSGFLEFLKEESEYFVLGQYQVENDFYRYLASGEELDFDSLRFKQKEGKVYLKSGNKVYVLEK